MGDVMSVMAEVLVLRARKEVSVGTMMGLRKVGTWDSACDGSDKMRPRGEEEETGPE
jgi:hypothetical protein